MVDVLIKTIRNAIGYRQLDAGQVKKLLIIIISRHTEIRDWWVTMDIITQHLQKYKMMKN